ncbi:uncharacterized protein Z518_03612 [Rhinocladiella mackenziei CBS 650.93]|uniref:Cytochrome P450 n=1 Tax=Rhinocladiella mackenziei CBS 650.93 TaxID=1442369 RepID=A0A0D2J946_9EURO|nr:uncharacterized protein Z518_03612 [Rhinocladiella mackenziei CBS 650.93]KIX05640.1 hypothetical protein Z518_03612 [Rhinocladiella mackenziei CBS 650.93]
MAVQVFVQANNVLAFFSIAAAVFLLQKILFTPGTKYHYPPGPKGIPVFGNLFQMPQKYPGPRLMEWAKEYGDMFTLKLGSRKWVFLNSTEAVRDLLDRRGRLYISRPVFAITQDIAFGGKRVVLMGYTETWRNLRKVMHQLLMASNQETYKPFQDVESKTMVWQFLKSPERFYEHAARYSNYDLLMDVVFGRRTSMQEENTRLLFSTSEDFLSSQATPSTTLAEQFPGFVKALPKPLQWFRPNAERIYKKTFGVYTAFLNELAQRVKDGQDPQCFARGLTDVAEKYGFDETQKAFCVGTIIEAGSDTTRNQVIILIATAAKFPEWVATVRRELDKVCGDAERLPTFDDWNELPYMIAVIKESLRWRSNLTVPGVPRTLIEDDEYRGFKFEKGTIFTFNNFAICHNEREFSQNEYFRPERHLNADLQDALKGHLGFGAGRRLCPGHHVAMRNMFITFSRLLYYFDFKEVPGAPINDWEIEAMAHEKAPYEIQIIPRSEAHVRLIERECEQLTMELNELEKGK